LILYVYSKQYKIGRLIYFLSAISIISISIRNTNKRLARRPGELTASEDMEVKVENGLAALLAVVDDHAITFGQSTILGDLAGGQKQFSQKLKKINNVYLIESNE